MCGGHCWRTVAVGVAEGSWLRRERAEKVEVGRIVIVGPGSQARREAVGMIELAWLLSMRIFEGCQIPYLVEGRCGFQEAHREVLEIQVSLQMAVRLLMSLY